MVAARCSLSVAASRSVVLVLVDGSLEGVS